MRPGRDWLIRLGTVLLISIVLGTAGPPFSRFTTDGAPPRQSVVAVSALAPEPRPNAPTPRPSSPAPALPEGPALPPRVERLLTRIPILMYHEIGDLPNNNYVSAASFEAQMRWLAANGYQGVTLGEVYRHFALQAPLPPKPVAITFDDGYRSFYAIAVPILMQYGFRATSFIITGSVGRPEHMTWEQVEGLPDLGMEVGSHTVSHPDLRLLSRERLRQEVSGSKAVLEAHLGVPIQFFCYPSGQLNEAVLDAVREAGFQAAVTTVYGPATPEQPLLLLDRIRVLRTDTERSFAEKIQRASDQEP